MQKYWPFVTMMIGKLIKKKENITIFLNLSKCKVCLIKISYNHDFVSVVLLLS